MNTNNSINLIKKEFIRIKSLGYLKNIKSDSNDGGAGNTFEYHLGVAENNLTNPDFEGFEIKTKKSFTHSAISLFTKKPSSTQYGDNYMREQFGIPDSRYPNIKCFRTSIYAHRFSEVYGKYKIKLKVDRDKKKLYFEVYDLDEKILDNNVFWTFDSIQKGSKKLNNMIIVNADKKKIDGKDHFKYTDAKVLINYKSFDNLLYLIEEGSIRYDNRLGVYGPDTKNKDGRSLAGTPHNHGGGLRIMPSLVEKLFDTILNLT